MYIRFDENNIVCEIIPDIDPVFPGVPIEERYPADFVSKLRHFPDGTDAPQGWVYDEETDTFHEPEPVPPPEPTYTADDLFAALLGMSENSSGGGGRDLATALAALGPERYNALSNFLHAFGFCGEVGA